MNSKTILLVEDNADDEALTFRALMKNNIGSQLVVARDGAAHGDPLAGILWLQQALEICREEMPARVYDAVGALALALLSAGHIVPARAHLQLQMGISQGRDERAVSALLQLEGSPTVPLPLKDLPSLEPAPAGVPWQAAFQRALDDAQRGQWKKAADAWTAAGIASVDGRGSVAQFGDRAKLFGRLHRRDRSTAKADCAWVCRKTMPSKPKRWPNVWPKTKPPAASTNLSITYTIANADAVQEKLAADRRFERLPLDTRPWAEQNEPPPRAAYSMLDRPLLASASEIAIDRIPNQLGQLLLFGKQTDREARLELMLFRPELAAATKRIGRGARDRILAARQRKRSSAISAKWNTH